MARPLKSVPGKDEVERNDRASRWPTSPPRRASSRATSSTRSSSSCRSRTSSTSRGAPPGSSAAKEKAGKKKIAESQKKFGAWLTAKDKQLTAAQNIYLGVMQIKQAHWVIAAAARVGQLYQDFSGQLYTAPVPKAPAAPAGYPQEDFDQFFHDAYCDAMVDKAEPVEAKAIDGLSICLNKSTDLSFYDEWSKLCEAELNQLKPVEYPIASEIRAQPGYGAEVTQPPSIASTVQPLESK